MSFRLIQADCVEAMSAMEPNSVDAIVTDPPYGLEFMGKEWDKLDRHGPASFENLGPPLGRERTATAHGGGRSPVADKPRFSTMGPVAIHAMQEWHHAWATEALRVLKPGGHLLAFGGTRTYHRLACAIEDAGFEIRDCLAWMYGSGFPKSLDVSKAIDKAAGAEREVVGVNANARPNSGRTGGIMGEARGAVFNMETTAPATPEAQHWNGWGTALKPAFEPIVLARKPLSERNVAANVLRWGTGALNIDGCRIDADDKTPFPKAGYGRHASDASYQFAGDPNFNTTGDDAHPTGRWPANVTLDETAAAMLDEQSGERASSGLYQRAITGPREGAASIPLDGMDNPQYADAGGASRFFKVVATDGPDGDNQRASGLTSDGRTPSTGVENRNATPPSVATRFRYCPKADRAERNNGLGHMTPKARPGAFDDDAYEWAQDGGHVVARPSPNHHPTVKPIALMAWLCRMVTPKGGTVLDPFTGSGSTGIAALREGFEFIGIEREAEYVEIARARIIGDAPLFNVEDSDAQPA